MTALRRLRFQARVFLLIVLVALMATGATAWLTAATTTAQLTESAAVEAETADHIYRELTEYAATHGTWEGVAGTVRVLGERTGQRLRLTTLDGIVIADTDTLAGRTARSPSSRPAIVVDPRPQLPVSDQAVDRGIAKPFPDVLTLIAQYRYGIRFAACLTRNGIAVRRITAGEVWEFTAVEPYDPKLVKECYDLASDSKAEQIADREMFAKCMRSAAPASDQPAASEPLRLTDPMTRCSPQVFADRLAEVAPGPLQLKLGFGEIRPHRAVVSPRRVLAAASTVAALAIACTLALSHRVLSSIATLSRASRRLGAGDLSQRVPERGTDEIAQLAASFNRMADSLQRSEERQRRMINDIAHELRTPLSNIRGYLEALQDGVLKPDRELFTSLYEEAVLQQRLIDDLQDLALAESGTLRLHRIHLDLAEFLETCATAYRPIAEARGVRLAIEADAPPAVHADPDRLRQVIGNLVSNAVRATPAGGLVTLRAGTEGTEAVITVADTGHGIAAEDLPHVFDRFWRADHARSRDTGGRGLGLAIAREIALAHGGTLTADSAAGAGSTFTVRLPVQQRATATQTR